VTDNETELVAALEADIQIWESLVKYVEHSIVLSLREKKSGIDDTRGMRELIAERHALIDKVKSG
jgi:hypothetical protein